MHITRQSMNHKGECDGWIVYSHRRLANADQRRKQLPRANTKSFLPISCPPTAYSGDLAQIGHRSVGYPQTAATSIGSSIELGSLELADRAGPRLYAFKSACNMQHCQTDPFRITVDLTVPASADQKQMLNRKRETKLCQLVVASIHPTSSEQQPPKPANRKPGK
jgi:hypothetical protein